jgi:hypothetical protein
MCAIIGSLYKEKLKDLYNLNAYRGELNYSLATFTPYKGKLEFQILFQDSGKMPDTLIDGIPCKEGDFIIAHSQAPTTNSNSIHPAVYGDALLWHNGIIKQNTLSPGTWDTAWLLEQIINYGWSSLSRVNGTFACIMYLNENLYVFRNEISPLFIDEHFNISSTKYQGSVSLTPNRVWKLNFETMYLDAIAYFKTMENPYYISEEA